MKTLETHWRILNCNRRLREYAERQLQPFCQQHGLNMGGLRILMALYCQGPMSMNSLAHSSCMAPANNSALCKALAKDGLILRQRAQGDERRVRISLSGRGEELMKDLVLQQKENLAPLAGRLPQQEVEEVLESMERLIAALEADKENAV